MTATTSAVLALALLTGATGGRDLTVEVVHVRGDGAVQPRAGVEVLLETWEHRTGQRGGPTLGACHRGVTGAAGAVVFPGLRPLGAGGEYRPTVVLDGVTFEGTGTGRGGIPDHPLEVRTYDVVSDASRLTASAQIDLSVRDAFLLVDMAIGFDNPDRVVVDLTRGDGLRFPVPLPSVFGGALDVGLIPSATAERHLSWRAVPEGGRLAFRRGQVRYEGAVFPGDGQTIQLRYALPIVDGRQDLAFTAPLDFDGLVVSASWPARTAPLIVPDRPYQGVDEEKGETRQRFASVDQPPRAGEVFVLHVDRLPVGGAFYTRVAVGGAMLLAVIFLLAMLAASARRRHA